MEKIKKYQDIITKVLEEYAEYLNEPNLETQAIFDFERNHFQLIKTGWDNGKRYHYCLFHFDIKNGKVWLQENRTDIRIAQEIEELGIPKSDIVLGIHSPEARARSGYAVA